MKRIKYQILLAVTLLTVPQLCFAGITQSKSFQVSVNLPAVVGLNVFPEGQAVTSNQISTNQDILREVVFLDNKEVQLETIVLK